MGYPSIFTPAERKFLLQYLDEWEDLKGVRKEKDDDGHVINRKDEFVVNVIQDFFAQYRKRDITNSPPDVTAFDQATRDTLHWRIKDLLNNASARAKEDEEEPPLPSQRGVSFNVLFKRKFTKEIIRKRNELQGQDPTLNEMEAYNKAVKLVMERVDREEPDVREELEEKVMNLKSRQRAAFEDQDTATQEIILELLPGEIVSTVQSMEKRTSARIYVLAVWTGTNGKKSSFDYASRNCGGFLKTNESKEMRAIWEDWSQEHLGPLPSREDVLVRPSVYPDQNGWPMLPEPEIRQMKMREQKLCLRRYFQATSFVLGGVQPSYRSLGMTMSANPGLIVPIERLPVGHEVLDDMREWRRAKLDAWIGWILDGQNGRALPFMWRSIPQARGETPKINEDFSLHARESSRMRWTTAELLYAETRRAREEHGQPDLALTLPPARRTHVYTPFSGDLFEALCTIHAEEDDFVLLLRETVQVEGLGPIHVSIDSVRGLLYQLTGQEQNERGLQDIAGKANPHITSTVQRSLARALQPADWLFVAFFQRGHPDYTNWSCKTLHDWITVIRPHIHKPTKSTYGGPLGVRLMIFAISRILQNVQRIDQGDTVPDELYSVVRGPERSYDSESDRRLLKDCIATLRRDIAQSRVHLSGSFEQRAEKWEREIRRIVRAGDSLEADTRGAPGRGLNLTSGVPRSLHIARAMIQELEDQAANEVYADPEVEVTMRMDTLDEQTRTTTSIARPVDVSDRVRDNGSFREQVDNDGNDLLSISTSYETADLGFRIDEPDESTRSRGSIDELDQAERTRSVTPELRRSRRKSIPTERGIEAMQTLKARRGRHRRM